MSYVESQLLSGEKVEYQAHLHRMLFVGPAFFVLILIGLITGAASTSAPGNWIFAGVWAVVTAVVFGMAWITFTTSEFAVTNKRVIIKVGWIRRRSLETLLSKVEGISVDQSVLGRILDYGTISVTGTGGTRESFPRIAAPLEFRRRVQDVVSRLEEARIGLGGAPAGYVAAASRDERDCPFCAERILVKAKVCKHCGRDVALQPG